MRRLVIVLGALLVTGAAHAQQHPWVPSNFNGGAGSQANNSAPAVADQHPWVPSSVYADQQQPSSAPAYAADHAPVAKRHHATETK